MQKRAWNTAVIAVAAIALISTARAQQTLNCENLDPTQNGHASRAFKCVGQLDTKLDAAQGAVEELQNLLTDLQNKIIDLENREYGVSEVPKDSVVAFDTPDQCPQGWSPFADGQSRVIVGATFGTSDELLRNQKLTERKYRDRGGAETVTLTPSQMPSHSHNMPFVPEVSNLSGNGYPVMSDLRHSSSSRRTTGTTTAGSNEAHPNIPPYIALYLCKKD